MSQQPDTVQYLCTMFVDLDKEWIKDVVTQFPNATAEFLTEQCLQKCQQMNAEKGNNHNQKKDHDMEEKKESKNNDHRNGDVPDLDQDRLKFLYPAIMDSDDVCFLFNN